MVFVSLAVFLFSYLVMSLWNWLIPDLFGVSPISWVQALGILVLSKILFGGFFRGGWRHRKHGYWKAKMMQKWEKMTPEQQEKFRSRFAHRCGWYPPEEGSVSTDTKIDPA